MPRRREVPKRTILPDPKFGNVEVSKFINAIMQSGKNPLLSALSMAHLKLLPPRVVKTRSKCSAQP